MNWQHTRAVEYAPGSTISASSIKLSDLVIFVRRVSGWEPELPELAWHIIQTLITYACYIDSIKMRLNIARVDTQTETIASFYERQRDKERRTKSFRHRYSLPIRTEFQLERCDAVPPLGPDGADGPLLSSCSISTIGPAHV